MTMRKLLLLYAEYQKARGEYEEPATIDDVIPI